MHLKDYYIHLEDYVKVQNRNYCISTNYTFDKEWETMVFEADANNNIISWVELYCKRYNTLNEAREGHIYIKNHIDEYIYIKNTIDEYITSKVNMTYESTNLCKKNKTFIKKIKD